MGPLLTALAQTRPAREDAVDNAVPEPAVAKAPRAWSAADLAVAKDMRERNPPAAWSEVCHVLLR
jgi:hypothetical protein